MSPESKSTPCPACGSLSDPEVSEPRVTVIGPEDQEIDELTKTQYTYNKKTLENTSVQVPLTDQELTNLKQQRDQNLDALDKVAVSELTQKTAT